MIWIAIKGRNHQEGRPVFCADTESDLIDAIRRRGFVPTEWHGLFEDNSGCWIRVDAVPFADKEEQP